MIDLKKGKLYALTRHNVFKEHVDEENVYGVYIKTENKECHYEDLTYPEITYLHFLISDKICEIPFDAIVTIKELII